MRQVRHGDALARRDFGKQQFAFKILVNKVHNAVDAVVAADKLQDAAIDLVKQALAGRVDWKAKRQEKLDPVKLNPIEQMMAFNSAKGAVLAKANPAQYPAPKLLLDSLHISLKVFYESSLV